MSKNSATGEADEDPPQPQDDLQADAEGGQGDEQSAEDALAAALAEASKFQDQYLRARAELENVRRRAERDVEAARKFGVERLAGELLGVRDSLELGLAASQETGADIDKVREGMQLTARMLAQTMEKFGVEAIDPQGQPFDPDYHEAVSTFETGEYPANSVVSVMQKGYTLNGRVLRPAMVVVGKAPSQAR